MIGIMGSMGTMRKSMPGVDMLAALCNDLPCQLLTQ
jgi:hypothetical protein